MALPIDRTARFFWCLLAVGVVLPRPQGAHVWSDPAVWCGLLWLAALAGLVYEFHRTGRLRLPAAAETDEPELFASDFDFDLVPE